MKQMAATSRLRHGGWSASSPRTAAVLAAAVCAASWVCYLLAFWPAILSDDSLDQWRQLLTLEITSYHPPVHTLTNWLVTRVWESPSMVALVQIAVLAALVGRAVFLALARRGSWPLTLAAVGLMALLPVHGLLSITLWKDIAYTCAVVWVSLQCFEIAESRGGVLASRRVVLSLSLALALTALFRHNGMPVAFGTVVVLGALVSGYRARVATVGAIAMVLIGGTQVSLSRTFHLEPVHPILRYQAPIHQLGALVVAGAFTDEADRELFERLQPRASWVERYDCLNVVPLLHSTNAAAFAAGEKAYRDLWLRGLLREPTTVARHVGCVSGMIWHPTRRPHAFGSAGIPENALGLATVPVVPLLHRLLYRWLTLSTRPALSPLLWGPAVYLYVVIVCAFLAWRRGGALATLPFVPVLGHTVVLILAIPSAEYRLQYPLVVVGTFAPALLSALRGRRIS